MWRKFSKAAAAASVNHSFIRNVFPMEENLTKKAAFRSLPMPSPTEVEAFRRLYKNLFSVELEPRLAYELATQYLHMFLIISS